MCWLMFPYMGSTRRKTKWGNTKASKLESIKSFRLSDLHLLVLTINLSQGFAHNNMELLREMKVYDNSTCQLSQRQRTFQDEDNESRVTEHVLEVQPLLWRERWSRLFYRVVCQGLNVGSLTLRIEGILEAVGVRGPIRSVGLRAVI